MLLLMSQAGVADTLGAGICRGTDRGLAPGRSSDRAFFAVSALIFATSAVLTFIWCTSMSAMPGMPMPGGWSMSMTWMRMPGQKWFEAAGSFIGMWSLMMIAMMSPSFASMLWPYRNALDHKLGARNTGLTTLVGLAYISVWILLGIAVYPLGLLLAEAEMRHASLARIIPFVIGAVVFAAGIVQFTSWKADRLDCCLNARLRGCDLPGDPASAWRYGLLLGRRCVLCCANITAVMLAIGVMDLRAMTLVTILITSERLAPEHKRVARVGGAVMVGLGILLVARASGIQ